MGGSPIRMAPNVRVILIGQSNVEITEFWGLGMSKENLQRDFHVAELFS